MPENMTWQRLRLRPLDSCCLLPGPDARISVPNREQPPHGWAARHPGAAAAGRHDPQGHPSLRLHGEKCYYSSFLASSSLLFQSLHAHMGEESTPHMTAKRMDECVS